ncbi:MAG: phosphosulfolactate synthase [Bacteroidota bacterium]
MESLWEGILKPPLAGRNQKPRSTGITMLIDKGLSPAETGNLLEMSAAFIDFIKLTFGTAALYQSDALTRKLELAVENGVAIYPGGTFFEIAYWQNKAELYFLKLRELGFKWVEISDGTIPLTLSERCKVIEVAFRAGLKVITEAGKKNPNLQPDEQSLIETINNDLKMGVSWVIIEARESGKGIGIFDNQGGVIEEKFNRLNQSVPQEKLIWEAPLKQQQVRLINQFGPNVNLGNIPPAEALALEALRLGFRSDTWKV